MPKPKPTNVIKLVTSNPTPPTAPVEQPPPMPEIEWLEFHVEWSLFCLERFDEYPEVRAEVNSWELKFLEAMSQWTGEPTERQSACLDRLMLRVLKIVHEVYRPKPPAA